MKIILPPAWLDNGAGPESSFLAFSFSICRSVFVGPEQTNCLYLHRWHLLGYGPSSKLHCMSLVLSRYFH